MPFILIIDLRENIHIFCTLHIKQHIEYNTNIQALSIIFTNLFENTAFKEIDFILTLNEKPILAIEAKPADAKFSPQPRRFREAVDGKFSILQVVQPAGDFSEKGAKGSAKNKFAISGVEALG